MFELSFFISNVKKNVFLDGRTFNRRRMTREPLHVLDLFTKTQEKFIQKAKPEKIGVTMLDISAISGISSLTGFHTAYQF
jgi:hypothetical protein